MNSSTYQQPKSSFLIYAFAMLLVVVLLGTVLLAVSGGHPATAGIAPPDETSTYLAVSDRPATKGFSPADIPPWLFVHVGIIASFQLLSLVFAAWKSTLVPLRKRDARV